MISYKGCITIVLSFCVLSSVCTAEEQYSRVMGDDVLVSDDRRSKRTIITTDDILEKTYSESRDVLEGAVYKISTDKTILTIQDAATGAFRKIAIQPDTVFSGARSLEDLNINDTVYIIYHLDLAGDMVTTHVHLVAREDEGSPYAVEGSQRDDFISYLINSLTVPEEHVRSYAVYALGKFSGARVATELAYALREDDSSLVRINAAKSLGQLRDPSTATDLVAAFRTEDKIESYQINRALFEIGKPAVEALIEGLYQPDKNIRRSAAQTLGEIEADTMSDSGTYVSAAFGPLVSILDDDSILVRQAADDALKAITGQDFGKDADAWRVWLNERRLQ